MNILHVYRTAVSGEFSVLEFMEFVRGIFLLNSIARSGFLSVLVSGKWKTRNGSGAMTECFELELCHSAPYIYDVPDWLLVRYCGDTHKSTDLRSCLLLLKN